MMTGKVASCLLIALAPPVLGIGSPFMRGLHGSGSDNTISPGYSVQRLFFSEVLSDGDKVVLLEEGPFKLEALCKNLTYTYDFGPDDDDYYYSYYYSDSSYYSDSPYYSDSSYYADSSYYSDSSSSSDGLYCDPEFSTRNGSIYTYTERIAALDLTFTADEEDYVYGHPNEEDYYTDEPPLVGPYEAGESRNMTVFEGTDGGYRYGYGDPVALRSTSGYFLSIPEGDVIGIQRCWARYVYGGVKGFPEGVDCMLSGFIHYVAPI